MKKIRKRKKETSGSKQSKQLKGIKVFNKYGELLKHSESVNKSLRSGKDFERKKSIKIYHSDGSELELVNFKQEIVRYEYNFATLKREKVYIIYTEHHGVFVYFKSDLTSVPKITNLKRKK